jgi:integrase
MGMLSGHVEYVRRGWWRLVVNLPSEILLDDEGRSMRDARGRTRRHYPRLYRLVEASGKKAAEQLLSQWTDELQAHRNVDADTLTVAALCPMWLSAVKHDIRGVTWETYERNMRLHVLPVLGERIAKDLRKHDLAAFYADSMKEAAETTVHHWATALSAMYSWAVGERILVFNPAKEVKRKPRIVVSERSIWDVDEIVKAVIAARGRQAHSAAVLAGLGGLRVGEICALRWEPDVRLDGSLLCVFHTVEEQGSRKEGTRSLVEYPPKGRKEGEYDVVPITSFAVEELREAKRAQDEMRLAWGGQWNPEGWVVPKLDGSQMWPSTLKSLWLRWLSRYVARTRKTLEEQLGRQLGDSELPPVISLHGLRDSIGSDVYKHEGVKAAQLFLRHRDPATTLRHYVRVSDSDRLAGLSRMEQDVKAAQADAQAEALQNSRLASDNVVSFRRR